MGNGWKIAIVAIVVVAAVAVLTNKQSGAPAANEDELQILQPTAELNAQSSEQPSPAAVPQQPADEPEMASEPMPKASEEQAAPAGGVEESTPDSDSQPASEASPVSTEEPASEESEPEAQTPPKQLPRFVEVGADSCIPCKMMQPILDELRADYAGELRVEFADVWKNPELGETYAVRTIPTQVIYDADGNEVFRHIGFWPKEDIDAKLKELGIVE